MNEMVEQVAHALSGIIAWDEVLPHRQEHFRTLARTALLAAREPTPEMLAAAIPSPEQLIAERETKGVVGYRARMDAATTAERLALAGRWRDMIDASLADSASR